MPDLTTWGGGRPRPPAFDAHEPLLNLALPSIGSANLSLDHTTYRRIPKLQP